MARKEQRKNDLQTGMSGSAVSLEQPRFSMFVEWRTYSDFPWPVWAAGWLAIFKALLWLATDPFVTNPLAEQMAIKFLVLLFPFLVTGIGVWNLRKWAVWGLTAVSVIDLVFYIAFPGASRVIVGHSFIGLAVILLAGVGPLGDILILLTLPSLLRHAGKSGQYRQQVTSEGR